MPTLTQLFPAETSPGLLFEFLIFAPQLMRYTNNKESAIFVPSSFSVLINFRCMQEAKFEQLFTQVQQVAFAN